jgi:hypothetical protein
LINSLQNGQVFVSVVVGMDMVSEND